MPALLKSRLEVWNEVWTEVRHGREGKIMSASYALAVIIYGLLKQFAPEVVERALKIPALATLLSFRAWVILALVILLLLTLEGVYRVIAKREKAHQKELSDLIEAHQKTMGDLVETHQQVETAWLEERHSLERMRSHNPDIVGKIEEAHFKSTSNGLFITILVFLRNRGATTTLQPFKLKYSVKSREHMAREEVVTDYCLYHRIKKPLWPSFVKEEEYDPLNDLSVDNLKPLDQVVFRRGWLRFRIPTLISEYPQGDQLTLEVTDATDTIHPITIQPPWPTTGVIRLINAVEAEWAIRTEDHEE